MKAWAVYEGARGRFIARPFDGGRGGFVTYAGGETEAVSRERAHRLEEMYNREVDEMRAERKAARAARRER